MGLGGPPPLYSRKLLCTACRRLLQPQLDGIAWVVARLGQLGHDAAVRTAWMNDWMTRGFHAFARMIMADTAFSFGDAPTLADVCLVPQLYNARRWGCDLAPFARLTEIEARCLALPGFAAARPELQPDAT